MFCAILNVFRVLHNAFTSSAFLLFEIAHISFFDKLSVVEISLGNLWINNAGLCKTRDAHKKSIHGSN